MNEFERQGPKQPRTRSLVLSGLLLGAGILIGVVMASELGWLPFGHAVPDSPVKPVQLPQTAPPTTVSIGGDRNFVSVAKAVKPAVVNIFTSRTTKGGEGPHAMPFDDPFFRRFFGEEFFRRFEVPRERKERSLGSGVIVDPKGLIITNNHVVSKADEIKVLLSDKRELKAKLIGTDSKTDLAVLKIETEGLHTIPWADSDKLEVGEFVLAVGNPFGLNQTVTLGIVSAVGRASMGIAEYEDFIQTDAAINPGNSGGPLVNARGELVGVNTAIFSQSGGNMGIGFAVPSNMVRTILDQLVKSGRVVRGWLGVSIQDLSSDLASQFGVSEPKGVLVSDVLDASPAKRAGLERGDVIIEFDGKTVENPTQLRNAVAQTAIGKKATVKFIRDKGVRSVDVAIVEQPKTVAEAGSEESGESATPASLLSDIEVRELNGELASRLGLSTGERGVVIVRIRSGTVADEAGLKEGDIILEVNRKPVPNVGAYERVASKVGKEQAVLLLIKRQGHTSFITLKP
ncbi:MAG: DegQ family serine endoprotease [Nitrospirae bacterium]|nr:MAG: DegQ family serine endoprotease [Nitrospirota bacterium]